MQLASFLLSLSLHVAFLLLVWFWPSPPPLRLDTPPITISLVDGAPGGNRTPSPILGHMGQPGDGPMAPTPPAPKSEIAAPERIPTLEQMAPPDRLPPAPEPEPIKMKPDMKPVEDLTPVSPVKREIPPEEPKIAEPKKEEPKKEEPKKEPPKKVEAPKPAPPKVTPKDPVAEALAKARKATSRAESGDRGSAVEQALAQAKLKAGGGRGGGGGEGEGPGGGGLGDVYQGQVMLAVRPNWGYATSSRVNYVCQITVKVALDGTVQKATIARSSGNAQFDASAVNAILRTSQAGDFPPPPNKNYTDLELVFSFDELMGR
ncbi:MAG: TonB family protein [Desulfovibrio sp.]|jgi:TonB family protein|nr:TonB family protein [Desulfovibrio sp.]